MPRTRFPSTGVRPDNSALHNLGTGVKPPSVPQRVMDPTSSGSFGGKVYNTVQTVTSVVTGITATAGLASAAYDKISPYISSSSGSQALAVVEQNVSQDLANASSKVVIEVFNQTVNTTGNIANEATKEAARTVTSEPAISTISNLANEALAKLGLSGFVESARSTISWGVWGFKMLPTGVQFLIGATGLTLAFVIWRSARGSSTTVHVHIHNPTPQLQDPYAGCKPVKDKDGNIVMQCPLGKRISLPSKDETERSSTARIRIAEATVLRKRLESYKLKKFISEGLKEEIEDFLEAFTHIKESDMGRNLLIEARNLSKRVQDEQKQYYRKKAESHK